MRKNAKERKNAAVDEEIKVTSFLKIIIAILIVLVLFSLLTYYLTNKDKKKNNSETPATVEIQYEKILVGSILNRSEEDYYVLVMDANDANLSIYTSLISTYTAKEGHKRFYKVDLSDPFNSTYVGSENNLDFDNILNVKFAETTLLHVTNGKVTSSRTQDDIATYLQKISA